MAEHFGALALPVGEFLALEHGTEFVGYTRIQEEDVVATTGHRCGHDDNHRKTSDNSSDTITMITSVGLQHWDVIQSQ